MRTFCLSVITLGAILSSACSGGGATGSAQDSATMTTQPDSCAIENPAHEEEFTAPDLTFAEVKGHVKKITEKFDGKEYLLFEFDQNGVYQKGSRLEFVKKLERDNDGRIVGGDNGYFKVTWADGKVEQTVTNESDGTLLTDTFKYDAEGNLVERESRSEGPDGDYSWTLTYNYGNNSFDSHGNWVSRSVHSTDKAVGDYRETRTIQYQ